MPVPTIRLRPDRHTLLDKYGLLRHLLGTWIGTGFNLIMRPNFAPVNGQQSDHFLEINLTQEILKVDTIGAPIPNRGLAQGDITLFGLHYLQQISDLVTFGALHIEPGIWINIPATTEPDVHLINPSPPHPDPADNDIIVARLATIPHGTALVAQGQAKALAGGPHFAPANTTPFNITTLAPVQFPEFDLGQPATFRSPLPPPSAIPLATLQAAVTNPNTLLQAAIQGQQILNTTLITIATSPTINVGGAPPTQVNTPNAGGGTANIPFLNSTNGVPPVPPPPHNLPNANAAEMFSTFWIEEVQNPFGAGTFLQLQYSQTVNLNFAGLTWPHVSVATLVRSSVV
jgi:hypothetical protein